MTMGYRKETELAEPPKTHLKASPNLMEEVETKFKSEKGTLSRRDSDEETREIPNRHNFIFIK